jgi:lysophospholipase L1-like esterase
MKYNNLTPFKWCMLQSFPFIEATFDAVDNYQLLCKVVEYLNKTIDKTNMLGTEVEQFENYFNNLDVQDEVNKKLDEMAESGELAELISKYLESQAIIAFNNVNSLSQATNLANGSFAKTYGKITYNDGLGAFYKIRNRTNQDVVDGDKIVVLSNTQNLVAEKIYSQEIINLENEIKEITNQTTIMIGDSFIQMFPSDNWALKLKEKLNLSDSETYIFGEGGAGMYQAGNAGHNFKQLLESKASQITNPNEVKRIICCGGTNDVNASSKAQVLTEVEKFVNYCKTTYPNAKIYIGMIGYFRELNAVSSRGNIINRVLPAYIECRNFGAIYLNDVEYVMHDYSYYTDTVHPTSAGTSALASAIFQSLENGHVEFKKEQALNFNIDESDVIAANITWYDVIANYMHNITMNGNFQFSPRTMQNSLSLDLGTPNSSFMRLSNIHLILKRYNNLRITTMAGSSIFRSAILSIDNTTGHLKLFIENYGFGNVDINGVIIQDTIIVPWLLW